MKENLRGWFALSIALHAALLCLPRSRPPDPPAPTFVEIAPPLQERGGPKRTGKGSRRGGKAAPGSRLSLADLSLGPTQGWGKGQGFGSGSAERGGSGSAVLDSLKQAVPMQNVGDQVESALDYPLELRDKGIQGTVTADVRFTAEGKLERPIARSQSNYLRVHVLRVLRRSLTDGLPSTYMRGKPLHLSFRFDFILSDSEQLIRPEVREVNGSFHLQRVGRAFGEWKLGPLRGVWFVPAVALDPEWIVDEVGKSFSRKAEIDPLDSYRRDPNW